MTFARALALLCVLLAPLPVGAQDGGPIRDDEITPGLREVARGLQLVREGQRKPEQLLRELAARAAEDVGAREGAIRTYLYGHVLLRAGDREEEARRELERALSLWPRFPAALEGLAELAARAGDLPEARRNLMRALEADPSYVHAYNALAQLAMEEQDFARARELFERGMQIEPTPDACRGLAMACLQLRQRSYDDREKERLARRATSYADAYVALEPDNGHAHLMRGSVYNDVGEPEKAISYLEESVRGGIADRYRLACLDRLANIYTRLGKLDRLAEVFKRMLEEGATEPAMRDALRRRLADLEALGSLAFTVWEVEYQIGVLRNEGISTSDRREALRVLAAFFLSEQVRAEKGLAGLHEEVFRSILRTLIKAPPRLSIAILQFLGKEFRDPLLLPILVHFVYPFDDATRTPEVRVEAIRTIADVAGMAGLPALYYCLRDEPGSVLREVDKSLTRLCSVRSPVGEGLEPLTDEQKVTARRAWQEYFHGVEGSGQLRTAIEKLRACTEKSPEFNRTQLNKPIADHLAQVLVLDGDVPDDLWLAAYGLLRDYVGKEFRPVGRRGTPVEIGERAAITEEVDRFWSGQGTDLPPPEEPREKPAR